MRVLILGILGSTSNSLAIAGTFGSVRYDAQTDELVVTMIYRGTNPNHMFTLQWDVCQGSPDGGQPREIAAQVLDDQWNDTEQHTYNKTVHFALTNLVCRPANVTLRTAPSFYYTVFVPRPAPKPQPR